MPKKLGLSACTIRLYEQLGRDDPPRRTEGGIRGLNRLAPLSPLCKRADRFGFRSVFCYHLLHSVSLLAEQICWGTNLPHYISIRYS